ncbi:PKD domain-containing protein, partial [bacterium]|nr:PKD domain-containing protein [bacterium]
MRGLRVLVLMCMIIGGSLTAAFASESTIFITYGADSRTTEGDNDFKQAVFFSIPASITDSLYLRIFDADVGGLNDAPYGEYDTETRFRLYGGEGTITAEGARSPLVRDGMFAGTVLWDKTFGIDEFHDHKWSTFATVHTSHGELVEGDRVFKLVVEGLDGNDGNVFGVTMSHDPKRNDPPDDMKLLNFGPTIRLPEVGVHAELRFFVPKGTDEVIVHNFDLAQANVSVSTKFRDDLRVTPSPQGDWMQDRVDLNPEETGQDVAVVFQGGYEIPNDASFFIVTTDSVALPIELPIRIMKPNTRPVPRVELTAVSDCRTLVFDGTKSSDAEGHELIYTWDFGDGETGEGSRVVHHYNEAGLYTARLTLFDNSGHIGNASVKEFEVLVNHAPVADAGKDVTTVPGTTITFDASGSRDEDGSIQRYIWTLGDGARKEGKTITHVYAKPDHYTVQLRVEDDSDSPCNFDTDDMEVWVNAPPVVDIGPDLVVSPEERITFSGANSYDADGEITDFRWDFGDGNTGKGTRVTHAYEKPGRYRVNLTITDNSDVENNASGDQLVVTVNDPPTAIAEADRTLVATEDVIRFSAAKSVDRDGKLLEYVWTFGDGKRAEGPRVTHSYNRPGSYTAELRVRDDSGTSSDMDRDQVDIIVNHPPKADPGRNQIVTTSEVQFSASKSADRDGDITRYAWDFGDGTTGSGPEPVHVYSNPGTYTVTLTVHDDSNTKSGTDTQTMTVTVNSSPIADAGQDLIGAPGETLTFDGSRSVDPDGDIRTHLWDFGDGNSKRGETVTHAYKKPGVYTATLMVKDNT